MHAIAKTLCLASAAVLLACQTNLLAQGANVPIEENQRSNNDAGLIAKAKALKDAGKLILDLDAVATALDKPTPEPVTLPPVSHERLEPEAIAATARKALMRVGWLCLCTRCDRWHLNLAGGYAIAVDGVVATCHHVVLPDKQSMREGYLVAADTAGQIYPVTGILAADKDMDIAIIRIDAQQLNALPIHDQSAPGAAAYLFSDPLGVAGYFSTGIVNRYYWKSRRKPADANTLKGARYLRMHVSTEWGPGSSGAAVLDCYANVIGHVSMISPRSYGEKGGKTEKSPPPPTPPDPEKRAAPPAHEPDQETILVLHEAIPARGLVLMLKAMKQE